MHASFILARYFPSHKIVLSLNETTAKAWFCELIRLECSNFNFPVG